MARRLAHFSDPRLDAQIGELIKKHKELQKDIEQLKRRLTPITLPDAMPPTEHEHEVADITDFPDAMTPIAHDHGVADITDFPEAMPPTAHKASHAGGSDALTPADIGAATSDHTHDFSGVPDTRKITAGSGLAGGGDLSADRTIALSDALQSTTRVLAVSDTVMHSALTERSHDGQDEKIVKKFMVNGLGTIRLTFELRSSAGGATASAHARVYGNAVERALAKSSSTSYEPVSLDVDVFGTTLIEVAIYRGTISTTVYIRNVRVRYDVAEVGDEGVLLD